MSEPIDSPLWDVLLSTNRCYPGCACDDDVFELRADVCRTWSRLFCQEDLSEASEQLNALLELPELPVEKISDQMTTAFSSTEQVKDFLRAFSLLFEGRTPLQPKSLVKLQRRIRF